VWHIVVHRVLKEVAMPTILPYWENIAGASTQFSNTNPVNGSGGWGRGTNSGWGATSATIAWGGGGGGFNDPNNGGGGGGRGGPTGWGGGRGWGR
jgi:hypothetical protein